jgi:hypothetical protein
MGEFSRIIGVFLEPTKAFADIARRPSWFIPVLLTILAGVAYYTAFGQHVTWQRFIQHQMDTSPKFAAQMAQIPPEQRAQSLAMQAKFSGIGYDVAIVVITPLALLISAAIVMGIANAVGAGVKFKQVFCIMAYAGLPVIIRHLLGIVVMFLKNPDDFNLVNPLAFNPAAFMDPVTSSKFLYTIGTALDVFAIWTLLLGATGLKAAAGKRLTFGGALFAVATPFVVFTLCGATIAGMFS